MTPERWRLMEELFDAALTLPAAERDAFLSARCGTDMDLRQEVERLLQHQTGSADSLERLVEAEAQTVARSLHSWDGRRLGPWRIVRRIGDGGMGSVFLAVRDDEQYRQEVAIKTLKVDTGESAALSRFRHERQILAGLNHPHIARLIDGGETEFGTPYLVMEYVAGVPITSYCQERKLPLKERLELFRQVCDAVQYAHQMLVVHRDLKPANILVTTDGIPKLLDFGIARLLDTEDGPNAVTRTVSGVLLMTPEYASPEQVRGERVTTATDIYSAGAVLYELVTGRRARAMTSRDPAEMARAVCDTPPPETKLSGELDNVIAKAMHAEPASRYASASALSEDVRRYLQDMPVAARPDSVLYRARKYVRRHFIGVAAAAAIFLSSVGGAGAALWQARIAQHRFEQVRKLANRFLFDFDEKIRGLPGSTAAREMLVATALEYLDNLSRDARSDPGLQWELAKAYEKVGEVQGSPMIPSLGQTQGALQSYRKALSIEEDLYKRGVLNPPQRESLALAYVSLSAIYRTAGTGKQSVEAAQRGVQLAQGLSDFPVLRTHATLAASQVAAGDPLSAIDTAETMLRQYEGQMRGPWTKASNTLGGLFVTAGRAAARSAQFERAAVFFQRGIVFRERRMAEPELDVINARDLVVLYHGAGDTLAASDRFSLGRPSEAEPYLRRALALAERLAALDSKDANAQLEVARSAGKLGSVLDRSRPAEAIQLFRRVETIAAQSVPEGLNRREMLSAASSGLALALAALGRIEEAVKEADAGVAILEAEYTSGPKRFFLLREFASAWQVKGQVEASRAPRQAVVSLRKALELADAANELAPNDFSAAFDQDSALEALAGVLDKTNAPAGESEEVRRRLLGLWQKWSRLQPHSAFVAERLRAARDMLH